jgi:predicted O-methyltransferase YrrM
MGSAQFKKAAQRFLDRTRAPMARAIAKRRALRMLAAQVVRVAGSPSLREIHASSLAYHQEPHALISALFPGEGCRATEATEEAASFCTGLIERASSSELPYPDFYACELGTLTFLHAAVRLAKPSVVLETGVANGLSTEAILHALSTNVHGVLYSIDVRNDVGALVTDAGRWILRMVDTADPGSFERVISTLPDIDLFFHDADHGYASQMREFRSIWPRLRPGGFLASDDVDASYAFIDFTEESGVRPMILIDRRKIMGAVIKGTQSPGLPCMPWESPR